MKYFLLMLLFLLGWNDVKSQTWQDSITSYRSEHLHYLLHDPRQAVDSTSAQGISWFLPNQSYIVACTIEQLENKEPQDIPTYSGITKPFRPVYRLHFQLDGQPNILTLFEYAATTAMSRLAPGPYFLPFKDPTNGELTYGGGRYLDIPREWLDHDIVILDFNKAYNPLCAYASGFNCPVPPVENHLDLPILAGEKAFRGTYRQRE